MGSLNIEYPNIPSGTAETQLGHIKSYLYQLTEKLNLADFSAEKIFEDVSKAIDAESVATESNEETAKLKEYANLKALIIKTGDYAVRNSPELEKVFESSFGASSDFGKYFETLKNEVTANAEGIRQLFTYTAGINNENGDFGIGTKQFIKSGLLYYDDNQIPVFGVGVGVISTIADDNGEIIDLDQNRLATFAADEIAFWDQGTKVAYITDKAINFPAANIRGGSIHIGQEENNFFKVDVDGNLTIGDNFEVSNAGIAKFKSADGNTMLDLSAGLLSFKLEGAESMYLRQSVEGIVFGENRTQSGITTLHTIGDIRVSKEDGKSYANVRMSSFDVYDSETAKTLGSFWNKDGTAYLDVGSVFVRDEIGDGGVRCAEMSFVDGFGQFLVFNNGVIKGVMLATSTGAELRLGGGDISWRTAWSDGESSYLQADHHKFLGKSEGLITNENNAKGYERCSGYIVMMKPNSAGGYVSILVPIDLADGSTLWQIADESVFCNFTVGPAGQVRHINGTDFTDTAVVYSIR